MQEWAGCQSVTIPPGDSTEVVVSNLNPSSSYIFRLFAIAPGGEESGPGPEVAFDTEGGCPRAGRRADTVLSRNTDAAAVFYDGHRAIKLSLG